MLRGSSDLPEGCGAPSRHASQRTRRFRQKIPPYLVLLHVGFALPAALLRRRCALTAPFHPYLSFAARAVCFLWHFPSNRLEPAVPDVIRHTALRSSDFPPVFRRATVRSGCQPDHYSAAAHGANRYRGQLAAVSNHNRSWVYTPNHHLKSKAILPATKKKAAAAICT